MPVQLSSFHTKKTIETAKLEPLDKAQVIYFIVRGVEEVTKGRKYTTIQVIYFLL